MKPSLWRKFISFTALFYFLPSYPCLIASYSFFRKQAIDDFRQRKDSGMDLFLAVITLLIKPNPTLEINGIHSFIHSDGKEGGPHQTMSGLYEIMIIPEILQRQNIISTD